MMITQNNSEQRFLLLGCSKTKHPFPDAVPAIERYDGVFYRVLKKAMRDNPSLEQGLVILILSARYGLIRASDPILDYDERMTMEKARSWRGQMSSELDDMLRATTCSYGFVCMGKTYRHAVSRSVVLQVVQTTYSDGGIGKQMSQLKQWLCRGADDPTIYQEN